jgi:hypothetical protein
MMMDETLGRWLSEREGHLKTNAAIEAFGARFRASGPMGDLARALASVAADDADAVLAIGAEFLARADLVEGVMADLIRPAAADPFFRPPLRRVASPVHLGLLLLDNPILSILLAVTTADALAAKRMSRRGPASITFGGQRAAFRFLRSGGATISFWRAPRIGAGFSAGATGRCRLTERRRIEDGETIMVDGRSESFVIDHASSDIVYVQAVTPVGAAPVSVEYDSDSCAFVGASSTDEIGSRIQMMTSLLRILDRRDAAHVLRQCLASPHFYVRWHAMREFLAMDADLALPSLRAMAGDDPHPEVRAAAASTLSAFFPGAVRGLADSEERILCRA